MLAKWLGRCCTQLACEVLFKGKIMFFSQRAAGWPDLFMLQMITERINKIMLIKTSLVITGLILKGIWQRLRNGTVLYGHALSSTNHVQNVVDGVSWRGTASHRCQPCSLSLFMCWDGAAYLQVCAFQQINPLLSYLAPRFCVRLLGWW